MTASELSAMADLIYGFDEACVDVVINLSDSDFPVQVHSTSELTRAQTRCVCHVRLRVCVRACVRACVCTRTSMHTQSPSQALSLWAVLQSPAAIQAALKGIVHEARLDFFPQTGSSDAFLSQPEMVPLPRYPDR